MPTRFFSADDSPVLSAGSLINILKEKAPKVAVVVAAVEMAWPFAKRWKLMRDANSRYVISVNGDDDIYEDLHDWILSVLPEEKQRALTAWSSNTRSLRWAEPVNPEMDAVQKRAKKPSLRMKFDGSLSQEVELEGHKVTVAVVAANAPASGKKDTEFESLRPPKLQFTVGSLEGRDAVRRHLQGILEARHAESRVPRFWMLRWGDWGVQNEVPPRSLESVILPPGQLKRLTDDLERFLYSESQYVRRSIPYHRGYLFEGAPGTGKTSIAKALANHFGLDIYYLPLGDIEHDNTLLQLIGRVQSRSMLVLEDVDVYHAATKRDDDAKTSLSGILNALDGLATPHGLITVLTTNVPDVLDDALVRPGRVDVVEHFQLADARQALGIIRHYYANPHLQWNLTGSAKLQISPAAIVEACKNTEDPGEAMERIGLATRLGLEAVNA